MGRLQIRKLSCHESVCSDTKGPYIKERRGRFLVNLFNRSISLCKLLFSSRNEGAVRLLWRAEISEQVEVFAADLFMKDISRLDITVNYSFLMNKPNWDTAHCQSTKNKFFLKCHPHLRHLINLFLKTLNAFFHYNIWKVLVVLDNINDTINLRMNERSKSLDFSLNVSLTNSVTVVTYLISKFFSSISYPIELRFEREY